MAFYMSKQGRALWAAGAVFTAAVVWLTWPDPNATDDCGDLDVAVDQSSWKHDTRCVLRGTATNRLNVTMGKLNNGAPGAAKYAGLRRFVRLGETNVIAILPGGRESVHAWMLSHEESLAGYRVDAPGRLILADREAGYTGLGIGLRKKFGLPLDEPLWLFDTDPDPND